jgi:hypothetical protein
VKEATYEQLMQAVAGGDLDAFYELVLRYQGLAWKTACRFVGDSMEGEDIAQEAFLKIFPFVSWLKREKWPRLPRKRNPSSPWSGSHFDGFSIYRFRCGWPPVPWFSWPVSLECS